MSSQFVDINADGYKDILVGSFCGVPQIIMGEADGYSVAESIMDKNGETVLIADFWNYDEEKWDVTGRAGSEGHCTSAEAVDWDGDGDYDLLLGDYYGGRLFLRINEGTANDPQFATTNVPVVANDEQIVIEHGLAAPRAIDWNGDGLFDILCGGSKGGVYLYTNTGTKTEPQFGAAEVLIEQVDDPSNSFIRRVPAVNGEPTMPGSSYHIEAVDYDADGDLDLLIGGRCSWVTEPADELSDEEAEALKTLQADYQAALDKLIAMAESAQTDEQRQELIKNEDYLALVAEYQQLAQKVAQLNPDPSTSGDFVWLFRRK